MSKSYNREWLILEIRIVLEFDICKESIHIHMDNSLAQITLGFFLCELDLFELGRVMNMRTAWLTSRSTFASTRATQIP